MFWRLAIVPSDGLCGNNAKVTVADNTVRTCDMDLFVQQLRAKGHTVEGGHMKPGSLVTWITHLCVKKH
jgi:hypothetical protein